MKKQIMTILILIIIMSISVIVVDADRHERLIRVYGNVTIDGDGVEGADITVKNIDKGYEETTKTNGSGYYEVFIKAVDNNKIKVSVSFDEYYNHKSFVLEKFKSNYEVSFEFESTPDVHIAKKFYGFFTWLKEISLRSLMYDCLLLLLIVFIIVALFRVHKEIEKEKY